MNCESCIAIRRVSVEATTWVSDSDNPREDPGRIALCGNCGDALMASDEHDFRQYSLSSFDAPLIMFGPADGSPTIDGMPLVEALTGDLYSVAMHRLQELRYGWPREHVTPEFIAKSAIDEWDNDTSDDVDGLMFTTHGILGNAARGAPEAGLGGVLLGIAFARYFPTLAAAITDEWLTNPGFCHDGVEVARLIGAEIKARKNRGEL